MADILDFRPTEGKTSRRPTKGAPASSCEIVIFPGVRYERWETAAKEKPKSPRKRFKRDTLELND